MKITYNGTPNATTSNGTIDTTDDFDTFCAKSWELDSDNTSFTTIPMVSTTPVSREHASNFMRSLSQFLDMWYRQYHMSTTTTGTDIRLSISISKMDHK